MTVHLESQEIRVFRTVHELGGFKKAADRLLITQSAVSQSMASLERKLGTLLIQRGKPIALTESGLRLLSYAELAMQEERNVLTDISNIRQGIMSTLQIAMSGTVSLLYGNELPVIFECVNAEYASSTRSRIRSSNARPMLKDSSWDSSAASRSPAFISRSLRLVSISTEVGS